MITVSLIGGLGNQMFQYAAGKALAERHGFLLRSISAAFGLCAASVPAGSLVGAGSRSGSRVRGWCREAGNQFSSAHCGSTDRSRCSGRAGLPKLASSAKRISRAAFPLRSGRLKALGPQISLFGYFQSERYFNSIAGNLRDWFSPREPLGDAAAAALKRIETSRLPVSVHVRRGDYLKPGTHEVHGILGESFYRQVFDRLESMIGEEAETFHIFGRSRGGGASAEFYSRLTLKSCPRRSGASLGRHGADGALPASCDCQ